jgi:hypothetical protein
MLLYACQYQINYGEKLVMLLSAVERTSGVWKPLESVLRDKTFRKKLRASKNGTEAEKLLCDEIETYLNNYGSTRSVIRFYQENLTIEQKQRLVRGIRHTHSFKKQVDEDGTFYIVLEAPNKSFSTQEAKVNYELGRRLRYVVYNIRSGFVHQATDIPFPDKKYIKHKTFFPYMRFDKGEVKERWVITLPFETLHELTRAAFVKYWRNKYHKVKEQNNNT